MYYKNELDSMPGIYKCYGDIKYLRFKVRLEIVKSSMIPLSNIEEQETGLDPQYNEREEFEFSWNEKIFSPQQFKVYSDLENCRTPLEKDYHEQARKLISLGTTSPSNRLFTYISKDKVPRTLYRNILYKEEYQRVFFDNDKSYLYPHCSSEKSSDYLSLPTKNIIDFDPSDELRLRNRSLFSDHETMYIVADLSDKNQSENPNENNEHLLITITWNKVKKTLTVNPDFANFNTPGYKIDIDALSDTRYVYRYWILNVSKMEDSNNLSKIEKFSSEITSYQSNVNFSLDFEIPPKDIVNIFLFAEIQKTVGYNNDNLFVQYFIHMPEGWSTDNPEILSGITQQCSYGNYDDVAHFSYLFEVKIALIISKLVKENEDSLSQLNMPQLLFEICSIDSWKRFRVEGYAWTPLPTVPGRHKLVLNTWKPAPLTYRDELNRFFIGSDTEISDFTYPGIPSDFKNNLLSRYGFESISSGDIHVELNIMHQEGQATASKKSSVLLDKAKTVMLMNSVNHILEAFKKARERMLMAREPMSFRTGDTRYVLIYICCKGQKG